MHTDAHLFETSTVNQRDDGTIAISFGRRETQRDPTPATFAVLIADPTAAAELRDALSQALAAISPVR